MDKCYLTTGNILPYDTSAMQKAETIVRYLAYGVAGFVAYLSLCLLATPARGAGLEITTVANLPDCSDGSPSLILVVDGSSTTDCSTGSGTNDVLCECLNGTWAAAGGGGSGDITDVWGCTSGNCNALTAASGDSLDAGSADASSPATRSTSLPGTCSEGQLHQDTDSGATETYICTATNTWTKLGQGVILDLDDDGSNEASNMSELATDNDDYAVVTNPSTGKVLIDFAKVPPYQQYDPDRRPSSCAYCDEFLGDDDQLTWSWGNQGTATITYEQDTARLVGPAGTGENLRVRWITGADGSSTDWVATMKVGVRITAAFNSAGIALLYTGSEATPTSIRGCTIGADTTTLADYDLHTIIYNSYTSYNSAPSLLDSGLSGSGPFYIRMRYVTSSKGLYCAFSEDGVAFYEQAVMTLGAHPTTSIGFYVNAVNSTNSPAVTVYWFRQRTDATGIASPYPAGS